MVQGFQKMASDIESSKDHSSFFLLEKGLKFFHLGLNQKIFAFRVFFKKINRFSFCVETLTAHE